jgi:uncharacterized protein (DUF1501 family)
MNHPKPRGAAAPTAPVRAEHPTDVRPAGLDRRDVLRLGLGAAAGLALGGRAAPAAAQLTDYRALVCVFLFGGNDACNMLVPRSAAEYDVYARSRQNLAVANGDLIPVMPLDPDGAQYGFHPRMPEVARLFQSGRLGVVANVGPMIRPTTRDEALAGAVPLPPQLFSHNDQQEQWQTLKGRTQLRTGWAGRIADELAAATAAQRLPVNVSYFGTQSFQIGAAAAPYVLGPDGASTYFVLTDPTAGLRVERRAAFDALLAQPTANPIRRALVDVHRRSLATASTVNAALAGVPPLATAFPAGVFGDQLRAAARLIGARGPLGIRRQVFLVAMGGFDTHDDQNRLQPQLFGELSAGLAAFQAALDELGVADSVVTFTQSDFGRTLTSNGDGTDHGWGAHQLVMGNAVRGRRIHGRMPRLEIGGPDDTTGGRIIPTQACDQYAATLAKWFGATDAQVDAIAPNARNFPQRYLGFLPT